MSSMRHLVTNRLPRPSFLLHIVGFDIDEGIDIGIGMDIDIEKRLCMPSATLRRGKAFPFDIGIGIDSGIGSVGIGSVDIDNVDIDIEKGHLCMPSASLTRGKAAPLCASF